MHTPRRFPRLLVLAVAFVGLTGYCLTVAAANPEAPKAQAWHPELIVTSHCDGTSATSGTVSGAVNNAESVDMTTESAFSPLNGLTVPAHGSTPFGPVGIANGDYTLTVYGSWAGHEQHVAASTDVSVHCTADSTTTSTTTSSTTSTSSTSTSTSEAPTTTPHTLPHVSTTTTTVAFCEQRPRPIDCTGPTTTTLNPCAVKGTGPICQPDTTTTQPSVVCCATTTVDTPPTDTPPGEAPPAQPVPAQPTFTG